MSLKTGVIASVIAVLGLVGTVFAKSSNPQRPDQWALSLTPVNARNPLNTSTFTIILDHDGDLKPGRNYVGDLGESTHAWRKVYAQQVITSSGTANVVTNYINLPSSTTRSAAVQVSITIPTSTLLGAPTTYFSADFIVSSGAPRNIVLYSSPTTSGISTTTLIGSATFFGIDSKGNIVSEEIRFTTGAVVSSTFPNTNTSNILGYLGVGDIAFARISSVTIQVTSMTATYGLAGVSDFELRIDHGNKIGLAADVDEQADCYYITVANNAIMDVSNNPLLFINTINDTIVFPQTVKPNDVNDYTVWCKHMAHH